jgi:hypothetical protein
MVIRFAPFTVSSTAIRWPGVSHRFATGGCAKRRNIEPSGLLRSRPRAERLFSRLKRRGLERVLARRLSTVTTILLLGYLLITLRALSTTPPAPVASGRHRL